MYICQTVNLTDSGFEDLQIDWFVYALGLRQCEVISLVTCSCFVEDIEGL